ncbi:tRNA lysidine(34) synthetase TilS [Qipengyuania flava]|uniref:tRNA lysidine(34) synthetase TilS n=1 Tax=Qipengyuania flava TaxID=192812 RepID=UPI001C62A0D1|nr:tRNA lysidine(34) synthetase TilS [Qipengyuania flava]QYJ07887.1 tRNA lysidine(34) synthetase TilS [Qipengyuania flava]
MALLALAHALLGDGVEVATVDHGLRPEAREECALVERVCAKRGIACRVLGVTIEDGNLQDRARAARYGALGQWAGERGLAAIATAHHADDQAETLLMRLNRGSGLAGLTGIRSRTMIGDCPVPILRPLLGFRKNELRALVEDLGLPFVEDPSNRDASFDRVRMRRQLEQADWIDPLALARSAAHMEEAEATLQAIADEVWEEKASMSPSRISVPATRQPDTASRLLARAISALGGGASHGEVMAFLKGFSKSGNIAGVLIERVGEFYVCTPEPPRRTG